MSEANKKQAGGDHYKKNRIEVWDFIAANKLDYFQGQIIKYVVRFRNKNGMLDLDKAEHFIQKLKEIEKMELDQQEFKVTTAPVPKEKKQRK